MGKDLHYSILDFFISAITLHDKVHTYQDKSTATDSLFELNRNNSFPPVLVHLSDIYNYSEYDYYGRPKELKANSFVLIARPEAHFNEKSVEAARECHMGLGQIGKLLGALNLLNVWEYLTKEEREKRQRKST